MEKFHKIKNDFAEVKIISVGKIRKTKTAVLVSVFVVSFFIFMQAMEINGADTSQVTLTTDVQSAIDVSCTGSVSLGTLTAGSPVTGSTTCTTTTNSASGYELKVKRDNADYTLKSGSNYITDKTAWSSSSPNSALWAGTGLGFRVKQTGTTSTYNTTWWGNDDTTGNAKFAGVPSSYETVMSHGSFSASPTATVVEFKADVGAAQATGSYTGTVTFQAVPLP